MSDENIKLFAASLDHKIYTIDLHSFLDPASALEKLETELYRAQKLGQRYCRVVHGIGEGILASKVQDNLSQNPLVKAWKLEESGGSCVVVF